MVKKKKKDKTYFAGDREDITFAAYQLTWKGYDPSKSQYHALDIDQLDPETFEHLAGMTVSFEGYEVPLEADAVIEMVSMAFNKMRDQLIYQLTEKM